jgi:hypothetical protein
VDVIVDCALPAAENDDRVMVRTILRQRLAQKRLAVVARSASFLQRGADLTEACGVKILDDEDVHVCFCLGVA